MGLSRAFVESHIREWEHNLKGPIYPHRENWPAYLFHHAPLENAVRIMMSGNLLSRVDSNGLRPRDVAAPGVIDHSLRAHRYARLYFRPRTPTQYHIEGIRRPSDCQYGEHAHAPVLVMFVFDSRSVLCSEAVRFSDSNMQTGAIEMSTEAQFKTIPFEKVYHEGGTRGDRSITNHKSAEVLAPSPMALDGKLRWIYCRSEAERATLIESFKGKAPHVEKRIRVSDDLKVFEKRFTFVDKVFLANNGIIFKLNPRYDSQPIAVHLKAWDDAGNLFVQFKSDSLVAVPENSTAWRVKAALKPGTYRVAIKLDDHLAFDATLTLYDIPF